jgi:hypothetical protein
MTPNGPPLRPLPENCDFRIFTTGPARGYEEVATIDVEPGPYASNMHVRLDKFKEQIRPYVCRAGGDAALAYANGAGAYIKATVLKSVAAPPAAVAAAAPSPVVAADAACHADTQCKGARICVKGECVDPPAAAPAAAAPVSAAPAATTPTAAPAP